MLNKKTSSCLGGFTLVELVIAVAIISILAAVVIPFFGDSIIRSEEAVTKGNVCALRSALAIHYGDNEGMYPTDIMALTNGGKYLEQIPVAEFPAHS